MNSDSIEAILGISETKLGFFQEWQVNLRELRKAHAESEASRLANAAILEAITDIMMVLDEDMRILSGNRIFDEFFPGGPHIGKHCYELFTNRDTPCEKCPAFRCLRYNRIYKETEIFHLNGKNHHFEMVASPLPGSSSEGRSVLMLKRDVTLEKQLLAQIYQSEKMASVGALAAGVAHEINNPLTAIAGFAEGLQRRLPALQDALPETVAEDMTEYVQTILNECARCRDIVAALMNFSRPLPSGSPLLLSDTVKETLSLLKHVLKKKCCDFIHLELDENLPEIWMDETQMRQVLLNIVTNAIDAVDAKEAKKTKEAKENGTGEQGKKEDRPDKERETQAGVTIRTFQENGWAVLQVQDAGIGFDLKYTRSVFEPFFTTKPNGLGLGLSVCYNIISAHNGDISIAPGPGGGTTATVRLPLR